MCAGDDKNCPEFELHHRSFKETLDRERRSFLRSGFAAAGGVAAMTAGGISLVTPQMAAAAEKNQPAKRSYHHLPANAETVHWGYFSKKLKPQVEINSGDLITIEALIHHANDDAERMVKGDPGAESVFLWTKEKKGVNRRGAGPMDASLFGRGAGEGLGVHICTGPVYVRGAQEGDVIELRIIDVTPRPCANPQYPGKGEVVLEVMCQEIDTSFALLHFVVRDTGIGIPKEKLELIFEAFSQADSSTTRRFGGTGLGLAICHRLVHLMGGEIWARSEVHQGSQFHFTVRFAIAQEDRRPTPVHKNRPSIVVPNLHILVAEDNPANRILAGVTLKRAGFRVHEVENGRDAVDAVRRDRFDLVLMDCRMPVMDGYVATKHIRQLPSPSNRVPIIALTASAFKEDRERAEQAGMDDFLSKPFQSEELLAKCLAWAKTDVPHEAPPPVDFLSSLMGIFLETAPPVFENLLSAIESANWEDARSSAHWLRGGATRLLDPALQRHFAQMEEICGGASPSVPAADLEALIAAFRAACENAQTWVEERQSATPEAQAQWLSAS